MNKLIITTWNDKILTALVSDGNVQELKLEPSDGTTNLNNIYIGKVKNIVGNINSAFVEIGNGIVGYYSLNENSCHRYVQPHTGKLKMGDEIIVQVSRDQVKTKAAVLSSVLSFTGRYCVLTFGKDLIGFSGKITDNGWKKSLKTRLEELEDRNYGIIIRTNAYEVPEEAILRELAQLKLLCDKVLCEASYRTCYSKIHEAPPAYVASIRDSYAGNLEEIITDHPDIYTSMKSYLEQRQKEDLEKLRLYQDELLPLKKLYNLETALEKALNRKVWLKSGGYLIIEPTEALVVIDVNTGKYSGKKTLQDTILKINLEAAVEIARQLRLRNLSGIIIIDFIDMARAEDKKLLMEQLKELLDKDPVKTTVVGISKLNLVEVTRKKLRRPLYEQVYESEGNKE